MIKIIHDIPNDIIFMLFMSVFAGIVSYINYDKNMFCDEQKHADKKPPKLIPHLINTTFFCMCFYYMLGITNLDFLIRSCIASFVACLGFENILLLANKIINLINLFKGRKSE